MEDATLLKKKYEAIAGDSSIHHWVPQFFLKNFATVAGGEQAIMYRSGQAPTPVNVKNIAASKDLYTFEESGGGKTKVMEGIFSEHEGIVAGIISKILADKKLPSDEKVRADLAYFVALLRVRGPSFSDWLRNMSSEHIKLLQRIRAEHPESFRQDLEGAGVTIADDAEFEELRQSFLDPEFKVKMTGGDGHYFKQAMEICREIYDVLIAAKSWHLLVAPSNRHFVTSDNPVILQEIEDCPPHLAGGFLNGTVLLPISPRVCLVFRRVPLMNEVISIGREDVDNINKSTARASRRQIYAHLESRDLAILCNEQLDGDESKVTMSRLARFAPYYVASGKPLDKETRALKDNSVPFEEWLAAQSRNRSEG